MRSSLILAFAILFPVVPADAAEDPPSIQHANIELSDSTPSAAFDRIGRGSKAEWVGWSVETLPYPGEACCFSGSNFKVRSCSLSERDESWGTSSDDDSPTATEILVLLEVKHGRLGQSRIVSPSCQVKGGDRKLVWLGKVDDDASLALLGRLLDDAKGEEPADRLLAAIAYHASPKADALIEKRAFDRSADEESRKQAVFWAGNMRGEAGYRLIEKVLASVDSNGEMRQHATFALTQNKSPRAIDRIKRISVEDHDSEVRSQALFWLAQSKTNDAADWILARLDAEKSKEVREQAVFALAQLPDATDRLLQVLRSSHDPDAKRSALFWLGQSKDPRALDEIEKVLER